MERLRAHHRVVELPARGAWHDEVRLVRGAVEYRDGWKPPLD